MRRQEKSPGESACPVGGQTERAGAPSAILDLAGAAREVSRAVRAALGADLAGAFAADSAVTGWLVLAGGSGWPAGVDAPRLATSARSFAGLVAGANEPIVTSDLAGERRFVPPADLLRAGVVSAVAAPIPGRGGPIGVLGVFHRSARSHALGEVQLVRTAAELLGATFRSQRAERSLDRTSALFRAIVEAAVDGIVTIDVRGVIRSVNRAACALFGYAEAELLGRNVSLLMPSPDREAHDGYVREYLRTGRARIIGIGREVTGVRRDGTTFPLELAVSEVRVGGETLFAGITRDATERRRMQREILEIAAAEQRRIGRDLHDGLCQVLAGVAFATETLRRKLEGRGAAEAGAMASVGELVDQAITQARDLAHGLHPVTLEPNGLEAALRELAGRTEGLLGIRCRLTSDRSEVGDNTVATHLYRIAQESIQNALRHGRARAIEIGLGVVDGTLRLTVADDGRGLPKAAPRKGGGIGLQTMRYRAEMSGGKLRVEPRAPRGTVVTCEIPVTSLRRSEVATTQIKTKKGKPREAEETKSAAKVRAVKARAAQVRVAKVRMGGRGEKKSPAGRRSPDRA